MIDSDGCSLIQHFACFDVIYFTPVEQRPFSMLVMSLSPEYTKTLNLKRCAFTIVIYFTNYFIIAIMLL